MLKKEIERLLWKIDEKDISWVQNASGSNSIDDNEVSRFAFI